MSENSGDEASNQKPPENGGAPETPQDASEPAYLAVPRDQIISRESAISDLYVRLPTGKMIKVARKGDKIDRERIERFGEKSVDVMYVNQHDYSTVVREFLQAARDASVKPGAPIDKVVEQYIQVAGAVLTEVIKLPVTDESLSHANQVTVDVAAKLVETDDMAKALRVIFTLGDQASRHALGTVVVTNWLAKQMGWNSQRVLQPLTMGALLHDIGLKELPPELVAKRRLDMTQDEVELFETHPTRGVMILSQFPNVPAEVIQIVQQHHEMPSGQGFPARLRGDRMFPLAKLVSFGSILSHDIIDGLIERREFSIEKLTERLDNIYKTMYGSELSKAAKMLFTQKLGKIKGKAA